VSNSVASAGSAANGRKRCQKQKKIAPGQNRDGMMMSTSVERWSCRNAAIERLGRLPAS